MAYSFDGYSGSDIRDVCQSAQLKVVSELFELGAPDEIQQPKEITIDDKVLKGKKKDLIC